MVQSCAALTVKDSAIVQLELALVGLNGHRHRLVRDSLWRR